MADKKKSIERLRPKQFLDEVHQELKKSVWPTRKELMESTFVVIVSVIILASFVATSDGALVWLIGTLVG